MAPSYCTFQVLITDANDVPLASQVVQAYPLNAPILRQLGSQYANPLHGRIEEPTNSQGIATLSLPWASETYPTVSKWVIETPDRSRWAGAVPSIVGPIDLNTAIASWSWAPLATSGTTTITQGPPGVNPRGTYDATATYAVNDLTLYQGGTYIAVAVNGPNNGGAVTPGTNSAVWQVAAQAGFIAVPAPANQVYAGPTSGPNATPAVRALVPADIPAATTSVQGAAVKTATLLSDFASLATALTALGSSNPGHLVIHQNVTNCPGATIPSNVTLEFRNGAKLQPASGQTITHNGAIIAPPVQIFDTSLGTVKLSPVHIADLWVEWFGAKGDSSQSGGGTDSTAGIQAAINASTLGNSIRINLAGGIYRVTASLSILNSLNQNAIIMRSTGGRTGGGGAQKSAIILWDGPSCTFRPVSTLFLGKWNAATTYTINQVVLNLVDGLYYIALGTVHSSTTPDADSTNWAVTTTPTFSAGAIGSHFSAGAHGNGPVAWVSGTVYGKTAVVTTGGRYYLALQSTASPAAQPSTDPTDWSPADPMFIALTRQCSFEGIGFGAVGTKGLFTAFLVDADAASTTTCTKNRWVDCTFGPNLFAGSNTQAHVIYGVLTGLFNNNNCDQFLWNNCSFDSCDWASVYIPSSIGQSKGHHFQDCEFIAGNTPVTPYAIYVRLGSFATDNCHYYGFSQQAQFVQESWDFITNSNIDCEGCYAFGSYSMTQGGSVNFIGGRYTGEAVPLVAPVAGLEYFYLANGTMSFVGTYMGGLYSPGQVIYANNNTSATFKNTLFPNPNPVITAGLTNRYVMQHCLYWTPLGSLGFLDDAIIQGSNQNQLSQRRWTLTGVPIAVNAPAPVPFTLTNQVPLMPTLNPSAAAATGGNLPANTFQNWYVSYITASGETTISAGALTHTGGATGDPGTWVMPLTNIPLGPAGTTARKIYRQAGSPKNTTTINGGAAAGQPIVPVHTGQGANWQTNDWVILGSGGTTEVVQVLSVSGDSITMTTNLVNTYADLAGFKTAVVLAGTINDNTTTVFNDTAVGTGQLALPASNTSGIGHLVLGSFQNDAMTASTASAGTAGALPAQVKGYFTATFGGVLVKIPYYGN